MNKTLRAIFPHIKDIPIAAGRSKFTVRFMEEDSDKRDDELARLEREQKADMTECIPHGASTKRIMETAQWNREMCGRRVQSSQHDDGEA